MAAARTRLLLVFGLGLHSRGVLAQLGGADELTRLSQRLETAIERMCSAKRSG